VAETDSYTRLIALYKALGGGWEPDPNTNASVNPDANPGANPDANPEPAAAG